MHSKYSKRLSDAGECYVYIRMSALTHDQAKRCAKFEGRTLTGWINKLVQRELLRKEAE